MPSASRVNSTQQRTGDVTRTSEYMQTAAAYADDQVHVNLGYSLEGCDLDGDGDDELVIGSPLVDTDGDRNTGRVQVVPGGPWPSP